MNFLERIPTSWLLTAAALACLLLWAGPGWAQSSGDPAAGRLLFEDTPGEAPAANLTHTCTNCHESVQERRAHIAPSGGAFANISFDTAMSRFGSAIQSNQGGAMGQYARLDSQQIHDIAAYIADTPKLTAPGLNTLGQLAFVATAVGNAVTHSITLTHSTATTDNLQITGISLSAGASAFSRTGGCTTLGPSGTCTFSMTYAPTSTAAESKTLTVALRQGTTNFTRTITLNGSVQGATPPPSSGGGDSGGGGLGLAWLTGLALATAALAMAARRAGR
jgi:cytochrome c553